MPAHLTPRNNLGDARIDLHVQLEPFQTINDRLDALDAFFDSFYHETRRALAQANRHRRSAIKSIDAAQAQIIAERDELVQAGPYPAGLAI